jgi:ABC-type proline/glycine betaine transport system permease subunit
LSALGTTFFVIIFNFFLFRILPGDLTTVISKANTSPEVKQRLIEASGLDKPLFTQFGIYIKQLFQGDLGSSFYMYDNSSDVLEVIVGRIPNTVALLLTAEIIAIIIGMIIGTICAHKRATPLDTGLLSGSLILYSMPTFWFAMLLIFLFADVDFFATDSVRIDTEFVMGLEFAWKDLFPNGFDVLNKRRIVAVVKFKDFKVSRVFARLDLSAIPPAKVKGLVDWVIWERVLENVIGESVFMLGFVDVGHWGDKRDNDRIQNKEGDDDRGNDGGFVLRKTHHGASKVRDPLGLKSLVVELFGVLLDTEEIGWDGFNVHSGFGFESHDFFFHYLPPPILIRGSTMP